MIGSMPIMLATVRSGQGSARRTDRRGAQNRISVGGGGGQSEGDGGVYVKKSARCGMPSLGAALARHAHVMLRGPGVGEVTHRSTLRASHSRRRWYGSPLSDAVCRPVERRSRLTLHDPAKVPMGPS